MREDWTDHWVALIWEHCVLPTLSEHFFGEEGEFERFQLEALRRGDDIARDGESDPPLNAK